MLEGEVLSVSTLHGGAAIEAVDIELNNVLQNIMDPNTESDKMRKVVLEIKIKPNKERNIGQVLFQAKSQLAPAEALETQILIDKDRAGRAMASEFKTQQEERGAVLPINGTTGVK